MITVGSAADQVSATVFGRTRVVLNRANMLKFKVGVMRVRARRYVVMLMAA